MELWIRSQNKKQLVKIENIIINNLDTKEILGNYQGLGGIENDYFILGTYKSKERALEVLDEIQNILLIKNSFSLNDDIITKSFEKNTEEEIREILKQISVYQMPED